MFMSSSKLGALVDLKPRLDNRGGISIHNDCNFRFWESRIIFKLKNKVFSLE